MNTPKKKVYVPALAVPDELLNFTNIHYVNSIPGAGKTYRAEKIAKNTLYNMDSVDYVLIYVAPTLELLKQFRKALGNDPKIKRFMQHVHLIEAKNNSLSVVQQVQGKLVGYHDSDIAIKKVLNGSVILMTHEAFGKIPLRMKGKDRASVIFDEARKCMHSSTSMKIPLPVIAHLRKEYVEIKEKPDNMPMARWGWVRGKRLNEDELFVFWRKHGPLSGSTKSKFRTFLDMLRGSAQDVWVRLQEKSDKSSTLSVHVTLSPAHLFFNYGKVLILSAFFEYSQMYFMLKRQEIKSTEKVSRILEIPEEERIRLIDVTSQLIDEERARQINERRLSKTLMTYVLKDESLSKYHLQGGIVIPYRPRAKLVTLAQRYHELWEAEGNGGQKLPTYKMFLSKVHDDSTTVLESAKPRLHLLESAGPSRRSVVQALAIRSSELQRAWLKRHNKRLQPLLLCINAQESSSNPIRMRRVPSTEERGALWEQENIEGLLNQHKVKKVVEVPVVNHGLNDWMHLDTAAFMATLKMPRTEAKFLERLLVGYDPHLDRTVDSCIQFIFRTSVRDAKSDEETFMVVSDLALAMQVNKELSNHITVVPPSDLIPNWIPFSIATATQYEAPSVVRERVRAYAATPHGKEKRKVINQNFRNSSIGKEYSRLSSAINRKKKALEAAPKDKVLQQEIEQLLDQRANLKRG